jgi:mannose-1-phosphate guanylyltransferase/phosphomannomutase
MKAIILAGGLGTRLKSVTGEHPKPMAELLGRPLMEHIVELLRENGFDEICCTLRYRAGEIMAHFGDGRRFGVSNANAVKNLRMERFDSYQRSAGLPGVGGS